MAARAHGTFHERIGRVNAELAEEPGSAELLVSRAGVYKSHGDWNLALADLDRAAELDPGRRDLDLFRGLVLLGAERYAKAEAHLRGFLAHHPNHPKGRAARARALARLGRLGEAAEDYTRAVAHQPVPIPEYYHERARVLAAAGDANLDEAIRGLDEARAALGSIASLETYAVELEVRAERYEAALERLDRIAAPSPRQESWLVRRGEILERAGRPAEARAALRQALAEIEKLPAHRRATDAVARLEARAQEAAARLQRAPRGQEKL